MSHPINRPDCIHCRFMTRATNGEYRCRQYEITLHAPVSIFCQQLSPNTLDEATLAWVKASLASLNLSPNTLYTWVEVPLIEEGVRRLILEAEMVAMISIYLTWSGGQFWQIIRTIRAERRDFYAQHGYRVEE